MAFPEQADSIISSPKRLPLSCRTPAFFKANTLSSDPHPNLSKDKVRRLRMPILIVTGENTIRIHKLVNEELARLLPKAERATIPKAGHGSARENPQAFNEAVLKFLANHRP